MPQQPLFPTPEPRPSAPTSTVEGVVERIVFSSPGGDWAVVRFEYPERPGQFTAVGPLGTAQPGEALRLTGEWTDDKKFGRQFRVERFVRSKPATLHGMERYLGSGLVPGIGRVMAKRLVAHFGLDTLDVIQDHPERLAEVPGIGRVRSERIRLAWREQRAIQEVMVFLQGHGVSTQLATKIYRRFGDEALALVQANPYRLAVEIRGVGFKTADGIARELGMAKDAPPRAAAGALHSLWEATKLGHVYLPRRELRDRASALLDLPDADLERAIDTLAEQGEVVIDATPAPGGAPVPIVYPRALYVAETGLAQRLRRLRHGPRLPLGVDVEAATRRYETEAGLELAPLQRDALRAAVEGKIVVITGGPGTGKTTLVRALVEILERHGQRVALAAPTGRAAKRLAEATGRDASTLHRLLEFSPQNLGFERNEERPLALDALIVDEVSMLDTQLAHHLLRAVPDTARLVLVGDADQLPSVGPGSVLRDLLAAGLEQVRLSAIFRQAQDSLIVVNAHRILRGEPPRLPARGEASDYYFIDRDDPEQALETVRHLVSERIPRRFGFAVPDEIQLLSPMRKGILGTHNLNRELQELLNPSGTPVGAAASRLRVGDKVMQLRNNYQLEVFNGDLGTVLGVDEEEGEVEVRVDDRRIRYDARDLDQLELAYACSIHKSQGSEYPCVVIVLHGQHYVMLQRNLFYTALTRAQRLAIVVASRAAVRRAVGNAESRDRYTGLTRRLEASRH